jgi:SsrA-binding protein
MQQDNARVLAQNRRVRHEYHVLETVEAGLALVGTEVKAAREGKVQLKDSYVEFRDGEAYLVRAHISPYSHGNIQNHEAERPRKLLLQRREIDRLYGRTQLRGLTVVPLRLLLRHGWIKVEIALVQGKKVYDKRRAEKERELDKEAREVVRQRRW